VAAALQVTTKTIEFHKGRIKQKLGLRSTADLVRYAFRNRIIGPDA
jgi:DNA-binding CsgD family transcriptional regulator